MSKMIVKPVPPTSAIGILADAQGRKLAKIIRYSWWPKELVSSECGVSHEYSFSLTLGPLMFFMEDGLVLNVESEPSLNSVVVWGEKYESLGAAISSVLEGEEDLYPIDADDKVYSQEFFRDMVGSSFSRFSIMKNKTPESWEICRPSEVGFCIEFEDGRELVASHGLHNGSDDFSVLQIPQIKFINKYERIPLPIV